MAETAGLLNAILIMVSVMVAIAAAWVLWRLVADAWHRRSRRGHSATRQDPERGRS